MSYLAAIAISIAVMIFAIMPQSSRQEAFKSLKSLNGDIVRDYTLSAASDLRDKYRDTQKRLTAYLLRQAADRIEK